MEEKLKNKLPDELKDIVMKELLQNPFMGINITDGEGRVLFLNEVHHRITGHNPKQYLGHTMQEIKDKGMISESATMIALDLKKAVLINQIASKNNTFQVKAIPIYNDNGEIIFVINYLIDVSELVNLKETLQQIQSSHEQLKDEFEILKKELNNKGLLVFGSEAMRNVVEYAYKVAESDVTVLITGPSGSGKEHIANIIQARSKRKDAPFIRINCAAIPENLLESELFGYEAGAFTGGLAKGRKGLIESADKGTLLLDEIGELPMTLQSKLLRVLQDHKVRRVGGNKDIKVDFRLIASTNANIKEMIAKKQFREDLYYRLNVIEIRIPGLEHRREDIPLLVNYFLKNFNLQHGMNKYMSDEAMAYFSKSHYPGNVRELRNIVERTMILSRNDEIQLIDAYEAFGVFVDKNDKTNRNDKLNLSATPNMSLKDMLEEYEKQILSEYMDIYGCGTKIAKKLKTDQSTISRKLSKYNIKPKNI